jgi:hypothetical protein
MDFPVDLALREMKTQLLAMNTTAFHGVIAWEPDCAA